MGISILKSKSGGYSMFLEKNNKIRAKLFSLVDSLTDEEFNTAPDTNSWSPKQIIEHLNRLESKIIEKMKLELANHASPMVKKKPIQLTTLRLIKVKAPEYAIPSSDFETKQVMKKELHETRMRLLSLYANHDFQVFQNKSLQHPAFGRVPLVQWFPFIGLHEKRHIKQLEKTMEKIKGHKK